jgi:hypothetical protein
MRDAAVGLRLNLLARPCSLACLLYCLILLSCLKPPTITILPAVSCILYCNHLLLMDIILQGLEPTRHGMRYPFAHPPPASMPLAAFRQSIANVRGLRYSSVVRGSGFIAAFPAPKRARWAYGLMQSVLCDHLQLTCVFSCHTNANSDCFGRALHRDKPQVVICYM